MSSTRNENFTKLISIVTPVFNEEDNILDCYQEVKSVIEALGEGFDREHIFCDNASTDGSLDLLLQLAQADKKVKVIVNSRNFGPFSSMFNGLMATRGDLAVPLVPADLQDPPRVIHKFIDKWREGFDVVYGVRKNREESFVLRLVRRIYYRVVNRWANIPIPENVGEFTLITKRVVDSLRQVDDYYPYLRGLIANTGFKSASVEYTWVARKKGVSKNNLYALIDQGLNGLISFSPVPMRLLMFFGSAVAFFSIVFALINFLIGIILYQQVAQPGIQTLIVSVFFFSGIIIFSLGVVGEYVAAIHSQVRKRPLIVESRRVNFD